MLLTWSGIFGGVPAIWGTVIGPTGALETAVAPVSQFYGYDTNGPPGHSAATGSFIGVSQAGYQNGAFEISGTGVPLGGIVATDTGGTRGMFNGRLAVSSGNQWLISASHGFTENSVQFLVGSGGGAPPPPPSAPTAVPAAVTASNIAVTAAKADFTADGHADLLWQHANGQVVVWSMNGIDVCWARTSHPVFYPGWHLQGQASRRQRRPEMILRHQAGWLILWVTGTAPIWSIPLHRGDAPPGRSGRSPI